MKSTRRFFLPNWSLIANVTIVIATIISLTYASESHSIHKHIIALTISLGWSSWITYEQWDLYGEICNIALITNTIMLISAVLLLCNCPYWSIAIGGLSIITLFLIEDAGVGFYFFLIAGIIIAATDQYIENNEFGRNKTEIIKNE